MVELPIPPDPILVWYMLGIMFAISLIGMLLMNKDYNIKLSIYVIYSSMIFGGIFVIGYYTPISIDYNNNMIELIKTTGCTDLPSIAYERSSHKNEVVDEIVLRCLIDNNDPELISFLKGAT